MFADTAKMNLPVESPIEEAKEKSEGDLNAKTDGYEIKYVNFGLEERSKTEFYMDKQIEQIKLTTSSDKVFFNVNYDIHYYYGEEEGEIKDKDGNEPENTDENELYEVTKGIWVQIIPDGEVIGVSNLQSLRDKLEENNETTQGFKYINTDSIVLQGLTMNIRYKFTVFNLSETDTYGEKLDEILYSEENYINNEKIQEAFDKAHLKLKIFVDRAVEKSFNGVTQSSNKNTDLAMMSKLASSAVTSAFLVADNYNMVMLKSNGKDKEGAKEKANERIIQRLSALFYQSMLINWFNATFRSTYNSSLKGMAAVVIPNTITTEILTRKSIGMPVGRKTYEELQAIDEKNENRKGFLGKYFKFMRLLTGKKPLKTRITKNPSSVEIKKYNYNDIKKNNPATTNVLEMFCK